MSAIFLLPFTAAAPLLQGVMDARLQGFFQALAPGLLAFSLYRAGALRPGPHSVLLCAVAALSALSLYFSPVRQAAAFEWGALAAGFCLFFAARGQDAEARRLTDLAVRAAAWLVAGVALYQAFFLRDPNISATLVNPNALAFFLLLAGPVAAARGDFPLTAVLSLVLFLTGSLGALAALLAASCAAAFLSFRRGGDRRSLWLLGLLSVTAAAALARFDPLSAAGRFAWWSSAAGMIVESPLLGTGHSSFSWLAPLSLAPGAAEGSIYAHNHYLEFAAENGLPAALAWFSLLVLSLRSARGAAFFSLLAAMIHSALDIGLSLPANFWLFCVLAGRELPAEEPLAAGRTFPSAPAAAFSALLAVCAGFAALPAARYEKELRSASALLAGGNENVALAVLARAAALPYGRGAAEESAGRILFAAGLRTGDGEKLFLAAVEFEKALLKLPARTSSAAALRAVYGAGGAQPLAGHPRLGHRGGE